MWRALLVICGLLVSPLSHAHLLNMTKVIASLHADGEVAVDMQVDLTRAAGGPLEYYRLSRVASSDSNSASDARSQVLPNAEAAALLTRLAAAIDLEVDGVAVVLTWQSAEWPQLPEQEFVNPLNWPMTHVTLRGQLPGALKGTLI